MGFFFFRPRPSPIPIEVALLDTLRRIERKVDFVVGKAEEILNLANQINEQTNALAAQEQAEMDAIDAANGRLLDIINQITNGQSPTLDGIKTTLLGVTGRLTEVNAVSAAQKAKLETWGQDPANPFPVPTPPVEPPVEIPPTT